MAKRRENPGPLKTFLERDAETMKNHWLEVTAEMLGPDNSDADWYKVTFPSTPWKHFTTEGVEVDDYPDHVSSHRACCRPRAVPPGARGHDAGAIAEARPS